MSDLGDMITARFARDVLIIGFVVLTIGIALGVLVAWALS